MVGQIVPPEERREVRLVVVGKNQNNSNTDLVLVNELISSEMQENKPEKLTSLNSGIKKGIGRAVMSVAPKADSVVKTQKNEQEPSENRIFSVPFYSQFSDISSPEWQKVGCGIASLSMIIDFYSDEKVSVDTLLDSGIKAGAYITTAGWSHAGLIGLSHSYGLDGESVSLVDLNMKSAFNTLEKELQHGPVMVSVHYTFEPTNPIPHLVVVDGVSDGKVYYNDPAEKTGGGSISVEHFQSAWKKRYISIRPA